MSQTQITTNFKIDGVLTAATTAVLSDIAGAFGVKRNDTDAVVVADGVAMNALATGVYEYTFEDPADDLTYTYAFEFTYGTPSETYRLEGVVSGGSDTPNLYDLDADVEPYVVGQLPSPVLRQMLRKVAADFCMTTEIWEQELSPMVTVAHQAAYSLSVGSYLAYIRRVLGIWYDGTAMVVGSDANDYRCIATHEAASATFPVTGGDWADKWELVSASSGNGATWATGTRYPRAKDARAGLRFKEVDNGATELVLASPVVADGKLLDVRAVLMPTRLCAAYPGWLLERWRETIVNGTIGNLKAHAGKPWSDPQGARYYLDLYRKGKGYAKGDALTQRGPGALKVAHRRFV